MMDGRVAPAHATCDERWMETAQVNRHRVEIPHTCAKLAGHHASAQVRTHRCACGQAKHDAANWAPTKERVTA